MRAGRLRAGPTPVDAHVGSRMRLRRRMLGLSQEKLGEALGITFQQVQKYERGTNRIGASRLFRLACVMDVPITFFFDDIDPVRAPAILGGFRSAAAGVSEVDPLGSSEAIELASAFSAIGDPKVRGGLLDLAKALSAPRIGRVSPAASPAAPGPTEPSDTRVARRGRPHKRP